MPMSSLPMTSPMASMGGVTSDLDDLISGGAGNDLIDGSGSNDSIKETRSMAASASRMGPATAIRWLEGQSIWPRVSPISVLVTRTI